MPTVIIANNVHNRATATTLDDNTINRVASGEIGLLEAFSPRRLASLAARLCGIDGCDCGIIRMEPRDWSVWTRRFGGNHRPLIIRKAGAFVVSDKHLLRPFQKALRRAFPRPQEVRILENHIADKGELVFSWSATPGAPPEQGKIWRRANGHFHIQLPGKICNCCGRAL